MSFKSYLMIYKTYRGRDFTIDGAVYGEPCYLTVKVYNSKRPKAEVLVRHGWFSESRGYGGTSGDKLTLIDRDAVALCRGATESDVGVAALVDKLLEMHAEGLVPNAPGCRSDRIVRDLARWYKLAHVENLSKFVDDERRDAAFGLKGFGVGDLVYNWNRPGSLHRITGERFEWHPFLGGGWRYTVAGCESDRWSKPTVEMLRDWPILDTYFATPVVKSANDSVNEAAAALSL